MGKRYSSKIRRAYRTGSMVAPSGSLVKAASDKLLLKSPDKYKN